MALSSISIPFSILLLFACSLLFAQLSILDAFHPVRNDREDPYRRDQITLRRPTRHVARRPTSVGYYSHKRTSSLPHQWILAEKSNSTANLTSNFTSHQTNRRYKHKVRNRILGFIAGCLGGLISALILPVFFRFLWNCFRGRYRSSLRPTIFMPKVIHVGDLAFLEKEDELASLEVIGQGGSGKVYKSQLPGNPSNTVAIKQIMKRAGGGDPTKEETTRLDKWMRQIKSEITTVGYIQHKNLLPLVAPVSRPDSHFLIYQFMKNGSLLDVLMQVKTGQRQLHWLAKLRIAEGIAAGLEYLDMHHKPQILLDDNMEARITDFGLAREMLDAHSHMMSSHVAGTIGYIAPEYYQTLKFTAKSDIYSFGVILAVLAMGKQPTDEFFQNTEEMSLVMWLRNTMHADNAAAAIDPVLAGGDFDEQIKQVLRIACFCTVDNPKERPTSQDVKRILTLISNYIFLRS